MDHKSEHHYQLFKFYSNVVIKIPRKEIPIGNTFNHTVTMHEGMEYRCYNA